MKELICFCCFDNYQEEEVAVTTPRPRSAVCTKIDRKTNTVTFDVEWSGKKLELNPDCAADATYYFPASNKHVISPAAFFQSFPVKTLSVGDRIEGGICPKCMKTAN